MDGENTGAELLPLMDFRVCADEIHRNGDPDAPILSCVVLQLLCEFAGPSDLRESPEMFMHPEQARQLARLLIRKAKQTEAQAATHS